MDLKTLKATIKRNFIIQLRAYPKHFFIGNLLTGLYTAISAYFMYHLFFKGNMKSSFADYAGTEDYMSFVIVGTAVYIYVVRTCLNVSRSLITELREGTLESVMIAPFRRVQYFLGNMLQQVITTSGEVLIMVLFSIPFGLKFSNFNALSFVFSFVLVLFAFFSISMILACIMLHFRDTYISQNTLFALLFLLCGITFPYQYLPKSIQWISKIIPVTDAVTLIRSAVLLGQGIGEQMDRMVYLFILSSVYCFVGFKLMEKIEGTALEKIHG
ncbi:ABC-2 type transport system permease protein [Anaerosolibacter carboniphilus]|uniref:Transport permease protein n=1 Tax=Anaerosolibacter carboniphilus TaxID=1417629 RepID=A0A841L586_9FIRM|nr:ABC transporter permease [Anaerosolibacter carboniphilus]MBB6217475.1 ABC-2 type transport system permease protein [Anaerosolibacter carboniphilus]